MRSWCHTLFHSLAFAYVLNVSFHTINTCSLCCVLTVSCPNGDTAGAVSGTQTCTELVTSSTASSCYDMAIESACCSSCNAQNTGVAGNVTLLLNLLIMLSIKTCLVIIPFYNALKFKKKVD